MTTLRNRRKEMGLTLVELAERVGLTAGQLSRIERGSTPSFKTALALERLTGVSAATLADGGDGNLSEDAPEVSRNRQTSFPETAA